MNRSREGGRSRSRSPTKGRDRSKSKSPGKGRKNVKGQRPCMLLHKSVYTMLILILK